jgi:carbohydrate-binding DOMON domain-containing protein
MAEIQASENRRFTLTSGTVTTLVFTATRTMGIDLVNLSTTETVYVMEDAPVSSSDTMSIKLLPGMTYAMSIPFIKINFLAPGGAEVQAVPRGNRI